MGISSTGIGSGLDVNTIVSQLMSAERGPINVLQSKQAANNAKLSAFGTLKSAVSTFQTALKAMDSTSLGARSATSSDATVLGASASTGAVPGTYSIEVTQLAKQAKLSSAGVADANQLLGAGTMSIQIGAKAAIEIPAGDYSMLSLSKAINAAQAGVSATIVNDGTANGNRLVITANDSGAANTVKISGTGGMDQFRYDALDPASPMVQNQAPQDAKLMIDNILITKPSNSITDAVSGLTLNLLQAKVGTSVNVTVAEDKAAAKTAVTAFVEAYNKLNSTIKNLTSYNTVTKKGAALNGESGASAIITSMRKEMTATFAGAGAGGLTSLTDIGIGFQRDGTLAVNDVKLQKALDSNFAGVTALFSATDGYATRLAATATAVLGTGGVITSRTEGLNDSIKKNAVQQGDLEQRLTATEKRYRAQFSALDSMMSRMQSTSNFLTQQLSALSNNS